MLCHLSAYINEIRPDAPGHANLSEAFNGKTVGFKILTDHVTESSPHKQAVSSVGTKIPTINNPVSLQH